MTHLFNTELDAKTFERRRETKISPRAFVWGANTAS
jgi:hypothetical protein